MKTSMTIIIFFVAFLSILAISLVESSPLEACIRKNIDETLSPSPSNKPKRSHFKDMTEKFCRDEARIVMYFLNLNGKFPPYYVKALCNIFDDDDKKVKEYVIKKWLKNSKKLIDSLSCASL